jgi:hypothetical protein
MKLLRTIATISAILIFAWSAWTCKDEISGPNLSDIVFPAKNVSYSGQVQALFNRGCGGQDNTCHGPDTFGANSFALDIFDDVVSANAVVHPGLPDGSKLVLTVEGKLAPKMPPSNQPQLNANQIKGLRQWVAEGAQNN